MRREWKRVVAVVAAVMLVGTLAMSGTAAGAPTKTKQPNQPVSSGERLVEGTLDGTLTRYCQGSGYIIELEGRVRSSFLGVGDLNLYGAWDAPGYGLWELNTNRGYIGGSFFTVSRPDFVADPSVPWGFKVVTEKWLILEPIAGDGQFLSMGGFGGRLVTDRESPVWTYVQGAPCDENESLEFSTRLEGELTFGGWGTMHGAGEGVANLTGSLDPLDELTVDETLDVTFPSVNPCDGCALTTDYGPATVHTTYTHISPMTGDEASLHVISPDPSNVVRIEGEGWSLDGFVYRSGMAPWGAFDREIHITGGSGLLEDVDGGTFYVKGGQYTGISGEVDVGASFYGYVV